MWMCPPALNFWLCQRRASDLITPCLVKNLAVFWRFIVHLILRLQLMSHATFKCIRGQGIRLDYIPHRRPARTHWPQRSRPVGSSLIRRIPLRQVDRSPMECRFRCRWDVAHGGGNSVNENVNYRHFLQSTKIIREIPSREPKVEDIFEGYWSLAGK